MKLIDKDTLVAEIERRKKQNEEWKNSCKGIDSLAASTVIQEDINILSLLNTLEVKGVDNELQGIEKEVAEDGVNAIDRKRIPIVLKGELKVKFKNEFNTLWQTVRGIQFANVAKHIIERLCLHFAAWGAYNLKDYCLISSEEKHKMDIEMKEVDLEKEFYDFLDTLIGKDNGHLSEGELFRIAEYFFELGLKAQKGE